jgi:HEAT repeat protein
MLPRFGAAGAHALAQELGDPNPSIRLARLKLLGNFNRADRKEVLPQLLARLKDSDEDVRWEAVERVCSVDADLPSVLPVLFEFAKHQDVERRLKSVETLLDLKEQSVDVRRELENALNDKESRVRSTVARQLAFHPEALGSPEILQRICVVLLTGAGFKEFDHEDSVRALCRLGNRAWPQVFEAANSKDPARRKLAIEALAKTGPFRPATALVLAAGLDDPELQQTALEGLCRLGPLSAPHVDRIVSAWESLPAASDFETENLSRIGAPFLLARLSKSTIRIPERPQSISQVFKGLAASGRPALWWLLAQRFTEQDNTNDAFRAMRPQHSMVHRVLDETSDTDLRLAGLKLLVEMQPDPADLPIALRYIEDQNEEVSVTALRILARRQAHLETVVPRLAKVVSGRGNQAETAAVVLGELGEKASSAAPLLAELMAEWGRTEVAEALGKIGNADDSIVQTLIDAVPKNIWAANALARLSRKSPLARREILTLLDHPNSDIRHSSIWALEVDPVLLEAGKEALVRCVSNYQDEPAIAVLGKMGPSAAIAVPALSNVLVNGEPRAVVAAAEALGLIGLAARPAIPLLEEAARDGGIATLRNPILTSQEAFGRLVNYKARIKNTAEHALSRLRSKDLNGMSRLVREKDIGYESYSDDLEIRAAERERNRDLHRQAQVLTRIPDAIDLSRNGLTDQSSSVRMIGALVIGQYFDENDSAIRSEVESLILRLKELNRSDSEEEVRFAAAESLIRLKAFDPAIAMIVEQLTSQVPDQAEVACESLGLAFLPGLVRRMANLSADAADSATYAAWNVLRLRALNSEVLTARDRVQIAEVLRILMSQLESGSPEMKLRAAIVLGELAEVWSIHESGRIEEQLHIEMVQPLQRAAKQADKVLQPFLMAVLVKVAPLDREFLELLTRSLTSANGLECDIAAFGLAGKEQAIPILRHTLESSKDADVRRRAAWSLACLGKNLDDAVPVLRMAVTDSSAEVRLAALQAVVASGRVTADVMASRLQDSEVSVRMFSVSHLLKMQDLSELVISQVVEALSDGDVDVRRSLAQILIQRAHPSARVRFGLARLVEDSERELRRLALDALRELKVPVPAALPGLRKILRDESSAWFERLDAMVILAKLGIDATPAVPELILLLGNSNPDLRQQAAWTLKNIGPPASAAVTQLRGVLPEARGYEQIYVAWALAAILPDEPPNFEVLTAQLAGDDSKLSVEILKALKALGYRSGPALPKILIALKHQDPEVREWAGDTIGAIGPAAQPAIQDLITALSDDVPAVRQWSVYGLGGIGPAAVQGVPELVRLLDDDSINVCEQAIISLGKIKAPPEVVPSIIRIARDRNEDQLVQRALEVLPALLPPGDLQSSEELENLLFQAAERFNQKQYLACLQCARNVAVNRPRFIESIRRRVVDRNAEHRPAALAILGAMGEKAALIVPEIIPLLEQDVVAEEAFRALHAIAYDDVQLLNQISELCTGRLKNATVTGWLLLCRGRCRIEVGELKSASEDFAAADAVLPDHILVTYHRALLFVSQNDRDAWDDVCRTLAARNVHSTDEALALWTCLFAPSTQAGLRIPGWEVEDVDFSAFSDPLTTKKLFAAMIRYRRGELAESIEELLTVRKELQRAAQDGQTSHAEAVTLLFLAAALHRSGQAAEAKAALKEADQCRVDADRIHPPRPFVGWSFSGWKPLLSEVHQMIMP